MTFTCQQCGECCSTMGEIIEILEQTAPLCYRIGYTTTFEKRLVEVDPDKKDLFLCRTVTTKQSLACPFLRKTAPGRSICTVHSSRPDLCRQYSCFRILISDPDGKRIGKVTENTRYLVTMDHRLREVWNRDISGLQIPDEELWEDHVERLLSGKGYRVIK
ncbi:YkgJ family cysteine cluster protein [uncultured Methanoregula sp.]|uniref:YkgJ family cysteine cluster protein n=1 Tax=uncultured Methanoregula sp. TaxID=1005933 RepID=UPI002AAB518A|nr:YkgJ family cysteine cluster protein [uncultured Methanoregula sp.]